MRSSVDAHICRGSWARHTALMVESELSIPRGLPTLAALLVFVSRTVLSLTRRHPNVRNRRRVYTRF